MMRFDTPEEIERERESKLQRLAELRVYEDGVRAPSTIHHFRTEERVEGQEAAEVYQDNQNAVEQSNRENHE
jgi:hypothetical protein